MEDSDDDEDIIDHYAILSISDHASPAEIRKAYLKASRAWHPDKNLQNPEHARKIFQLISDAYELLSDANQRKVYDQLIDSNPTPSHGSPSWRRSAPPNRGRATTADSSARSSSHFAQLAVRVMSSGLAQNVTFQVNSGTKTGSIKKGADELFNPDLSGIGCIISGVYQTDE